jgi:hypothetical protein
MKKIILLIIMITSISLAAKAQTKSQQLAVLKENNIKAYFNIISYGLKWCNENDLQCRDKREETCLLAYNEIIGFSRKSDYNSLALAVSIHENSYKVNLENNRVLNLIDYVGAYGDYEEKYKNLNSNELYRLFPDFLVKN